MRQQIFKNYYYDSSVECGIPTCRNDTILKENWVTGDIAKIHESSLSLYVMKKRSRCKASLTPRTGYQINVSQTVSNYGIDVEKWRALTFDCRHCSCKSRFVIVPTYLPTYLLQCNSTCGVIRNNVHTIKCRLYVQMILWCLSMLTKVIISKCYNRKFL